jgi:hypothetical protein
MLCSYSDEGASVLHRVITCRHVFEDSVSHEAGKMIRLFEDDVETSVGQGLKDRGSGEPEGSPVIPRCPLHRLKFGGIIRVVLDEPTARQTLVLGDVGERKGLTRLVGSEMRVDNHHVGAVGHTLNEGFRTVKMIEEAAAEGDIKTPVLTKVPDVILGKTQVGKVKGAGDRVAIFNVGFAHLYAEGVKAGPGELQRVSPLEASKIDQFSPSGVRKDLSQEALRGHEPTMICMERAQAWHCLCPVWEKDVVGGELRRCHGFALKEGLQLRKNSNLTIEGAPSQLNHPRALRVLLLPKSSKDRPYERGNL